MSSMEVTALGVRTLPSGPKTADSRAHTRASQIPQLFPPKNNAKPSADHYHYHHHHHSQAKATVPPSPAAPALSPTSASSTSLPLRALRSFLPFGSGKSASSNAATPAGPLKSPFAAIRRSSVTIERRKSGQFPGLGDDKDVAVISISPKTRPPDISSTSSSADAHESSSSAGSASHGELGPPLVTFNPEPPLSTELSTIPESDLSGISRHLSRDSDVSGNRHSKNSEVLPPPSPEINEVSALDTSVLDLSVLDLSTSQLKEEVMHALKEKPSKNGWLTGVVVEDAIDSLPARRNGHEEREEDYAQVEPEESFNLGALDPDLAALLSLNRMRGKQTILLITTENPPPLTTRPSPLGSSPIDASPSSATGSTRSQPSPVRTTAPHVFTRAVPARFMPRLMRSTTDRTTPVRGNCSVENIPHIPSDSAIELDEGRRVSSDSVYPRRSSEFQHRPSPPPTFTNFEPHCRVGSSRLATPACFGTHASAAASSRILRSDLPSSSAFIGRSGGDPPSLTFRAASFSGTAPDRLNRPRISEDGVLEGRPTARGRLGYTPRNRNRSRVASPGPRTMEWLGPRTTKAFAAAGLLDRDITNTGSRFASVRSLGDRDQRALAPSRMAFSEAGSVASSWRSGSVSRATTHSEAAGHDSTRPRTLPCRRRSPCRLHSLGRPCHNNKNY
ncbi:hypothetical protein BGW80DRAFT_1356907 [Lactifluus volemus]|nr:hypothetical protein BGW80DRAFT_1356907 [Lactifluus volemus]